LVLAIVVVLAVDREVRTEVVDGFAELLAGFEVVGAGDGAGLKPL
jgi:hypothetical protein